MFEAAYYISRVWAVEAGRDLDVGYCAIQPTQDLRRAVQTMRKHYHMLEGDLGREIRSIEVDFRIVFWIKDLPLKLKVAIV